MAFLLSWVVLAFQQSPESGLVWPSSRVETSSVSPGTHSTAQSWLQPCISQLPGLPASHLRDDKFSSPGHEGIAGFGAGLALGDPQVLSFIMAQTGEGLAPGGSQYVSSKPGPQTQASLLCPTPKMGSSGILTAAIPSWCPKSSLARWGLWGERAV